MHIYTHTHTYALIQIYLKKTIHDTHKQLKMKSPGKIDGQQIV